jgi:superfamily II DNA or RNA helicase/phage anti-repressor protein
MLPSYIQTKGYAYEDFVCNSLINEYDAVYKFSETPEYIIAKTKLYTNKEIYLKYSNCDIGADLVAVKDDQIYFIQCKNYDNVISINDLCTFYFLIHEYDLNGIVVYNGKLTERLIDLKTNKVTYVNLPFNNTILNVNFFNSNIIEIKPRDYQLEIYNKFKTINRGAIALPCGMGKTYCSWLIGKDFANIIIISPKRCLADTNLVSLYKYSANSYNPILISMDGTRNVTEITGLLKESNIISSTYDSVDVLNQIIPKLTNYVIFIDEYHNLSSSNLTNLNDSINLLLNFPCKTVFLSATPPTSNKLFGEYTYKYDWNKAIANKYICDFKIIQPEETIKESKIFSDLLDSIKCAETDKSPILKLFYLLKGIKFYGNKKTIIYVSGIKEAEKYQQILNWLPKLLQFETNANIIDYTTAKIKRKEYINSFINGKPNQILLNVQILNEGIDIPECDSIFITNPTDNIINLVQRMCRCNRVLPNKNVCFVYLWTDKKVISKITNYFESVDSTIKNKLEYFTINNINNTNKQICDQIVNKTKQNYEENINDFLNYLKLNFPNSNLYSFMETFKNLVAFCFFKGNNDFLIDSEILRKWLKINIKQDFVNTIKKSYKVNVDYTLEKIKKTEGSGGHNREVITLTPEATKKICLMTKSKMGNDVRQYFIDVELAFYKFKNHIIESLNKKIKELENNLKPKINSKKGIIYVFRALNTENATLHKIGRTISSAKRFSSHNSPLANDLEVIMTYEADNVEQLETCVKSMMKKAQYRKYKEIYEVDLDIIKFAIKNYDTKLKQINDMIDKKNKKLKGGKLNKITETDKIYLLIPHIISN